MHDMCSCVAVRSKLTRSSSLLFAPTHHAFTFHSVILGRVDIFFGYIWSLPLNDFQHPGQGNHLYQAVHGRLVRHLQSKCLVVLVGVLANIVFTKKLFFHEIVNREQEVHSYSGFFYVRALYKSHRA